MDLRAAFEPERQRPCLHPMCSGKARPGVRYCPDHAHKERQHDRAYDKRRGKETDDHDFYSSKYWIDIRKAFLAENPLCKAHLDEGIICGATEVDHIKPREQGGTEHWDNLQGLCKSKHSKKTYLENRFAKKRRGGTMPSECISEDRSEPV